MGAPSNPAFPRAGQPLGVYRRGRVPAAEIAGYGPECLSTPSRLCAGTLVRSAEFGEAVLRALSAYRSATGRRGRWYTSSFMHPSPLPRSSQTRPSTATSPP
jgi:hypothetical protein